MLLLVGVAAAAPVRPALQLHRELRDNLVAPVPSAALRLADPEALRPGPRARLVEVEQRWGPEEPAS